MTTISQNGTSFPAGAGNDTINITATDQVTVFGGAGDDSISVISQTFDENAANLMYIYADAGNDTLQGGTDRQYMNGMLGDDSLSGGDSNDTLEGGQGNDYVFGDYGDDSLNGNRGADTVYGNEGDDVVRGGRGADYVTGNDGNDTVVGDLGGDQLNGGTGADVFVLSTNASPDPLITSETDLIQDFSREEGDKIGLTDDIEFASLSLTATGQTRIDYTVNGVSHIVFLLGVNINLVESDFVTIG